MKSSSDLSKNITHQKRSPNEDLSQRETENRSVDQKYKQIKTKGKHMVTGG